MTLRARSRRGNAQPSPGYWKPPGTRSATRGCGCSTSATSQAIWVGALDRAALDVRRGWWEADLDTIVGELDRYREQLAHAAQPPEVNSADPYLAGPIGYSRP